MRYIRPWFVHSPLPVHLRVSIVILIARRKKEGTFWIFRLQQISGGNLAVLNPAICSSIFACCFYLIATVVLWLFVRRVNFTLFFYYYLFLWPVLLLAAWTACVGIAYSAFPSSFLNMSEDDENNRKWKLSAPLANSLTFGIPVLVGCPSVVLMCLAGEGYSEFG